jgi:hypothetical protein
LTSTIVPSTSCPDILMVHISLFVGLEFGLPLCRVCKNVSKQLLKKGNKNVYEIYNVKPFSSSVHCREYLPRLLQSTFPPVCLVHLRLQPEEPHRHHLQQY